MQKRDVVARVIGMLVFALGITVLVVSFTIAYRLFTAPAPALTVAPSTPGGPPATTELGRSGLSVLSRLGALFIMVLVGSMVASRGIQMYFAGDQPTRKEE